MLKNLNPALLVLLLFEVSCTRNTKSALQEQSKDYAKESRSIALRFQKKPLNLPISLEFPQAVWLNPDTPTAVKFKIINLSQEKLPTFFLTFATVDGKKLAENIKGFDEPIEIDLDESTQKIEKTIVLQLTDHYNFADDYVRIVPEIEVVKISSKTGEDKKKQ